MDVNDAATRENFVELIALQLVIAGTATDHHRFDVQVIQGVGHAVEQDPVVRDDFFGLVKLTAALLGVAAAQITRRQNRLNTGVPEHGLRGQSHLAEQAFGAATWEIKHRFRLGGGGLRVANNGHVILIFNVQQSARRFLGQAAWHLLVDEVNDLLFDGRSTNAGRRRFGLLAGKSFEQIVGNALHLHAHPHHASTRQLDGVWVGGVQHEHGRSIAGTECFLTHLAQQIAHVHGHFAKVNFDGAR